MNNSVLSKGLTAVFLLTILIAFPFSQDHRYNPVSVPLHHPVYEFLDRMETLGSLTGYRDGVKPLTRQQVARFLVQIETQQPHLTRIDRERLTEFLLDFRYETRPGERYHLLSEGKKWYSPLSSPRQFLKDALRFLQPRFPEEENHTLLWEDSLNNFYLDVIQYLTYDRHSDDLSRSAHMQTFRFRGLLNGRLGYALEFSTAAVTGDPDYREQDPILKGSWSQTNYGKLYFDRSGGELAYHSSFLEFRFAQQSVTWGWGESGQLILSDYVEQYPYLSLHKSWSWGSFTFLHGKLLAEATSDSLAGLPYVPDKWVAAHRLEINIGRRLTIGLTESLIYGNRYADWAYLVPFNLYRAIEHYLGDRDNKTMAIDAKLVPLPRLKLYGTIFLDEFKRKELFTDWYGNKHAFQLGMAAEDPFTLPNLHVRFEYLAIMPWVYTHKYNVNRYISNLRPLGYWAGPNSQIVYVHLKKDLHRRLIVGGKYLQWKHGENYPDENIGGDILLGHSVLLGNQQKPRETRRFLEGILNTQERFTFYVQYELFNDLYLNATIQSAHTRRESRNQRFTELHLELRFDY